MKTKRDRPTKIVRTFQGFTVNVERPAGTTVQFTTDDGKKAEQLWFVDYGYFPAKPSTDGDSLDAFLCFHEDAPNAYIVDQLKDGKPDQPKVMLGCRSAKEARSIFDSHRWLGAFGGMRRLSVESLRQQLDAWAGTLAAERIDDQNEEPAAPDEQTMSTNAKQGFSQLVRGIAVAALASGTLDAETRTAIADYVNGTNQSAEHAEHRSALPQHDGLRVRQIKLRAVLKDERTAEFVASDESVDSHGSIVRQNWNLRRFDKHSVILWAHDNYNIPIGRGTVRLENGELIVSIRFGSVRANPVAECVWQCILEDIPIAVSIGFRSHKVTFEKIDNREVKVCDDNELFEISCVSIPSNENALLRAESRIVKSLSEFVAKTADVPKTKEGRVAIKKTIGDAEATVLRTRGMCKVTCDCGSEMEIEMPMLAKMDEDAKALSTENATLKKTAADMEERIRIEKRTAEVKTEIDVIAKDGKLLPDELEDLVTLGVEKPERYAARMTKIRERAPLNAPDLTKRVDLGGETNPQRGAAGDNTVDKSFDPIDIVNRATSDVYTTRNTELGFAQTKSTPTNGGDSAAMISIVNSAA